MWIMLAVVPLSFLKDVSVALLPMMVVTDVFLFCSVSWIFRTSAGKP